jgi:hypothetical protein
MHENWVEKKVRRHLMQAEIISGSPFEPHAESDHEVTCRGSKYLIKQKTWSGGSGGEGSSRDSR